MKSINFEDATLKIGGKQEEYETLHAVLLSGKEKEVIMIFELTDEEVAEIVRNKRLYYSRFTFGYNFQPMRISTAPFSLEKKTAKGPIRGTLTEHGFIPDSK